MLATYFIHRDSPQSRDNSDEMADDINKAIREKLGALPPRFPSPPVSEVGPACGWLPVGSPSPMRSPFVLLGYWK